MHWAEGLTAYLQGSHIVSICNNFRYWSWEMTPFWAQSHELIENSADVQNTSLQVSLYLALLIPLPRLEKGNKKLKISGCQPRILRHERHSCGLGKLGGKILGGRGIRKTLQWKKWDVEFNCESTELALNMLWNGHQVSPKSPSKILNNL